MAVYQYLDGTNNDGTILGQTSAALIGFYNRTPLAQRSSSAQTTVTATIVAVSSAFGFTTSAQGIAVLAQLAEIAATLTLLGLWKGS